jgi:hypothetical protein
MARFHLPLATQEETICRAVSLYLLTQYFRNKQGGTADFTLQGLVKQYHDLQTMNMAMAKRIRAGSSLDAPVNALVILDTFAKALPLPSRTPGQDRVHLPRPGLIPWGTLAENQPPEP